jgi:rhodanese-related sulfurtransferase
MLSRRAALAAALFSLVLGSPAMSDQVPSIAAPDALSAARDGTTLLVDIRRPDEWAATGMAEAASGVTMEDPDFVAKVTALARGDRSRSITLICRTGGRTARTGAYLADLGFTNVAHVGEGMIGSAHGPGWLARGLPVTPR